MPTPVRDFYATLRHVIEEGRRLGLSEACDRLEARVTMACTTSSEYLGECGLAILAFRRETRGRLPRDLRRELNSCQREIAKVWPRFHPWWTWF